MFYFWLERLPIRKAKVGNKSLGSGHGSAFIESNSEKIFCREDFEDVLRQILSQIRDVLSKSSDDQITYKDFAKKIFIKDDDFSLTSKGDVNGNKISSRDRKSSLYKFMQDYSQSTFSTSYLIELVRAIIEFRHKSIEEKKTIFFEPKYKKFYDHISVCVEIDDYVLASGLKNERDITEALQKNNFIFLQITAFFLKNFESAVSLLDYGEFLILDPATSFLKKKLAVEYEEKFFSRASESFDVSPLIQEFAGAVALKLYSPNESISDKDKDNIKKILEDAAGFQYKIQKNIIKKRDMVQKLFIKLKDVVEEYERSCDDLRSQLTPTFIIGFNHITLNDKEKAILEKIVTFQNAQFEEFIPRWEDLLPLPSRTILAPLISTQISYELVEKNNKTFEQDKQRIELRASVDILFEKVKRIIFERLDSESKAGIQLIASYLSHSPPEDYRSFYGEIGIQELIIKESVEEIYSWFLASQKKQIGKDDKVKIKNYLYVKLALILNNREFKSRLCVAANEPRYSAIWDLKDIILKALNSLKQDIVELGSRNFDIK